MEIKLEQKTRVLETVKVEKVSILVFMEIKLEHVLFEQDVFQKDGFNPCFYGNQIRT